MHIVTRISSFLLLLGLLACTPLSTTKVENERTQQLELPSYKHADSIITHVGYHLRYHETHEQAQWVAYELTASEADGPAGRTNDFREDPSISTGSATLSDYRYSGYDRGHLIPAGDGRWSQAAMSATFLLSNMSPQDPSFNRGDWRTLESKVREWAKENRAVYVVTGPALQQGIKDTIGANQVSVPRYYYKVVLDNTPPETKAIGFLLPNEKLPCPLSRYAVSIDSLESLTGIDFYPLLPNDQEQKLESHVELRRWGFNTASGQSTPCDVSFK
ncbi:MAG TPA: DNA/RNA non-specific endonuclease [Fodinibius sp.]|nr:DNA/RNA non-specific endonuclease [Fodinibius sp.]